MPLNSDEKFNSLTSMRLSSYAEPNLSFDPLEKQVNYNVLAWVGGATLVTGIGIHIYQSNAWWQDQNNHFKFVNDPTYALGIDKVGHFYGTNLLAHLFSSGFEAANVQSEQSAIYGALAAFLFELYVEIEDGFGKNWGFSTGDLAADGIGAAYFVSQYYFPIMKNFQPRFSYIPTEDYISGKHKGNGIDDYEGQKYWIGLRMKKLLPKSWAQYWPAFLMISAGMGVRDLDGKGGGQREYYIGLDLDAEEIPLHGNVWQFVKNTLNYFHFPMPGIRITPDTAFFVFLF